LQAGVRRGSGFTQANVEIEAQLSAIKRMPQLIRSFFKTPSVAYIPNW
jgi:hypothetical protein